MALTYLSVRHGNKYGPEYTEVLKKQVPGLIVLGDDREFLNPGRYIGWWSKLEIFAPENRDLRPCLFIDLDTFVFDLTPFEDIDHEQFWMINDFHLPKIGESGLFIAPKYGISDQIWEQAEHLASQGPFQGEDGRFLRQFPHKRLNDVISGILSYKVDLVDSPRGRIVCFHGRPKMPDAEGWAKDRWNTLL